MKKQRRSMTFEELAKLAGQGTHVGASKALDKALEIIQKNGKPAISYSEFHGFDVVGENDPPLTG